MNKILAEININEHILPIFLINFSNVFFFYKKQSSTKNLSTTILQKSYIQFGSNLQIEFNKGFAHLCAIGLL